MKYTCAICGEVEAEEKLYHVTTQPRYSQVGEVHVSGLKEMDCSACGCGFVTPEQIDYNVNLVREAVRQKENGARSGKTLFQRLAGGDSVEEAVSDTGATLGPGKYLH